MSMMVMCNAIIYYTVSEQSNSILKINHPSSIIIHIPLSHSLNSSER